jgi:nanoRNase/pAp phosphatase (c-di-AMP/oligoRNAs hydrolase)
MSLSAPEKLRRFYKQFNSDDHVLVLIHADPDAIASAMAVKRLLWRKVASVAISSVNKIQRPDNIAMVRLLGVKLTHIEDIEYTRFTRVVLVDSQPNHHDRFETLDIHVVIDHHPETEFNALFTDIRPRYGATASILTEYLRAAGIKPSAKLATGLCHGIKTDTNNFERNTSIEDIKAFQSLFRHANVHLARKIEQADLRLDFLKYFKMALQNMRMRKGKVFVHLGPVVSPDVCVIIADFFMRVNPVKWSVVSGICDDKLVLVFRNDGLRKDAGRTAKKSFGHIGSAGGHKSMSRAEIPIENLKTTVDPENPKKLSNWIIEMIERRDHT